MAPPRHLQRIRPFPWSLARANQALRPGDTAVLLDGVYTGPPIAPARSGEEGKPITYRAAIPLGARFREMDGLPESNGPAAVFVSGRSHVAVEGIRVDDVKRWGVGRRRSHITVRDCRFAQRESV